MAGLIEEWRAEFKFAHINMLESYKGYKPEELRANPGDLVHPNALGHEIAAKTLFDYLTKNRYIE